MNAATFWLPFATGFISFPLVVALLAVLIHDGLGMVERMAARRLGRPVDEVS